MKKNQQKPNPCDLLNKSPAHFGRGFPIYATNAQNFGFNPSSYML